jgi:hypothetical protein
VSAGKSSGGPTAVGISRSEIGDIGYRGMIQFLDSYSPPRSCHAHVKEDLSQLITGDVSFILRECVDIAESRLQRLGSDDVRLSPDEALAVCLYTYDLGINSAMDNGEDNMYVQVNNLLRERNPGKLQVLKPYLSYMMRGLMKLPVFEGIVYRGIPDTQLELVRSSYKGGVDVHWSAFTSTTSNLQAAKSFAQGVGGVIFRIRTHTGRRISTYSQFQNEEEIMISPNARFVVTSMDPTEEDGYYMVDLMEKRQDRIVF